METAFQQATLLQMEIFKKYAGAEGKKDTLTKDEFKTLLDKEMPILGTGAASQKRINDLMKDLDENKDQEIDFLEYMSFVACITMCCFEMCKE